MNEFWPLIDKNRKIIEINSDFAQLNVYFFNKTEKPYVAY